VSIHLLQLSESTAIRNMLGQNVPLLELVQQRLYNTSASLSGTVASAHNSLPDNLAKMSLRSIAKFAAASAQIALFASSNVADAGTPPSCPVDANTPLSCHNTTMITDTCCFNAPGGPSNSWTVHGLW
jgi:hypothetical protein